VLRQLAGVLQLSQIVDQNTAFVRDFLADPAPAIAGIRIPLRVKARRQSCRFSPRPDYRLSVSRPFDNPRLFLEYAKDHSISLAIIDLQMPDLSGLEVQRILYDIRPKVPVIIITGEREPGVDRTIALDQGESHLENGVRFLVAKAPGRRC
jgi:hypothetical protein